MKYTKEQKIAIIKNAIKRIKENEGMCIALDRAVGRLFPEKHGATWDYAITLKAIGITKKEYMNKKLNKLASNFLGGYWYPLDKAGLKQRKAHLRVALKKLKQHA